MAKVSKIKFEIPVKELKKMIRLINNMVSESLFIFDKEGIKTHVVDPAHVAMAQLIIPKEQFSKYVVKEKRKIGIDLDTLYDIIKRWKNRVTVTIDEKKMILEHGTKYGTYTRTMTLTDPDSLYWPRMPGLDLPAQFAVKTKGFYEFIKEADDIAHYISITVDVNKWVRFYAESDTETVTFIPSSLDKYLVDKKYRSLFAIDYLLEIIKPMKSLFDTIDINMNTDNPIKMSGKNKITAVVLLAPRIEAEDEVQRKKK